MGTEELADCWELEERSVAGWLDEVSSNGHPGRMATLQSVMSAVEIGGSTDFPSASRGLSVAQLLKGERRQGYEMVPAYAVRLKSAVDAQFDVDIPIDEERFEHLLGAWKQAVRNPHLARD